MSLLTEQDNQLVPLTNYGVKTMSMGYLVPEESPVVWRGPMVMKAIQQLLHEVDWGRIDVLVLDLPPGTGDTQLTISQQVVLDGELISSPALSIGTPSFVEPPLPPSITLSTSRSSRRKTKQRQAPSSSQPRTHSP